MFWQSHRRPLRTYRQAPVTDFSIDGDVDAESILFPAMEGYEQLVVTFDRRNVYNATILAAAQALLLEVREPQTRRQLIRIAEVLTPQYPVREVRTLRAPSRAQHWQPLLDLAVDVLQGFSLSYDSAAIRAPGFILDTWRVWEALLTVAIRLACGPRNVAVQARFSLGQRSSIDGRGHTTTRTAYVAPDIVLRKANGLLVDAKYKGRVDSPTERVSSGDLYEALAFATATGYNRVALVYPAVPQSISPLSPAGTTHILERITIGDVRVTALATEVRGISSPGALQEFARRLSTTLESIACETEAIAPIPN
jgi:5-methylcytosine-specific restriction endonuclease McrBC regulatory subunit McrC